MKKALLFIGVLAASFTQAQVLYVNNSNGTYQAIDTQKAGDITFEESEQVIYIELGDRMASQFATSKITNIAPTSNNGTELIPNTNPTVSFDAADKENFNEIIQPIPTDELADEYGDFIENYSTSRIITITFSETGVKTSSLPSGITATINGGHIVINSTISKIGYQVKGTCSNGSLKIYSEKKFRLLFNGVTLTNPTGPAINIQSGKTVYASIVNGTTNTLCDGATYSTPVIGSDGEEEDQKGTLFSEGQLIFDGYTNGTGTLNVTSHGGTQSAAMTISWYAVVTSTYSLQPRTDSAPRRSSSSAALRPTRPPSPSMPQATASSAPRAALPLRPANST